MVDKARALRPPARTGAAARPIGHATRGTTAVGRMRRVDRWLTDVWGPLLRADPAPLVVDLGYGARPWTALELLERVRTVAPRAELAGLEIVPERVELARELAAGRDGVGFELGGFEIPTRRRPTVIRAFNVLRQYRQEDVADIWATMTGRLAPGGILVEGTCSEDGRRAAWVTLDADGPRTLTLAMRLGDFARPSDVAARLPKALIHRHVPGERIHALLQDADAAWALHSPLAGYGSRQRWIATARTLRERGWPVVGREHQFRRGELTLAWESVAPR